MSSRILNVIAVGVLLLATVIVGCSNEKTANSVDRQSEVHTGLMSNNSEDLVIETPYGTVTVNDLVYEKDGPSLSIHYSYTSEYGFGGSRILYVSGENGPITTCSYRVEDGNGDIMFGASLEVTESDSNSYTITEWTSEDSLSLRRIRVGDRMNEIYKMNGATFVVSFTEDELLYGNTSEPQFTSGIPGSDPPTDSPFDNSDFSRFREFYTEGNSLDGNVDGFVIVYIVGDPEFQAWLEQMTGIPGLPDGSMVSIEDICALAGMASFKCFAGGLANPICAPALGVSLACAGYTIWKWISNEDEP